MAEKAPVMKPTREMRALQLDLNQVTRTASVLNPNQIQKLWNSTREVYKYQRPGKGGGTWTYVKSSYVRKVLDSVFGFNWDLEIDTSLAEAWEVAKITKTCVVKATLAGRVKIDGQWVELRKTQFGRSEVKFKRETMEPLDFGNDMKAAVSDALKKCASLFGVAQDVYESEEYQEIHIIGSDEADDRRKATEDKVKAAKKVIKAQSTKVGDK